MDQNIILESLKEFKKGNKRRFLEPEYVDTNKDTNLLCPLWISREIFKRINAKIQEH